MPSVHFIGVGGVGMNGLAQLAALSGYSATGSDRTCAPGIDLFRCLESIGVDLLPQDGSGVGPGTDLVVYSTAIEADNPDIRRARELGIPLLHRAEFLRELVGASRLVAVAGTAGKTTTTGMLGWIFESLGHDPSVYNGAAVLNWKTALIPGNVRKGNSDLWIIEADESDKSFLRFHPSHAIITNISKDHYELDELHRMFDRFEAQTSGITVRGPSTATVPPLPQLLGRHNRENAANALALCTALGMDAEAAGEALTRFRGIERRLETVGVAEGVTVIDDYAHNPAKIAAAIEAVHDAYGQVHAFWRPHGFTPLHQNLAELVETFGRARTASLHILQVYYAGGTVDRKCSSADLVARLDAAGVPAKLVPDYDTLQNALESSARPGDAILGMGARDPELPRFAQRLVMEWKKRS